VGHATRSIAIIRQLKKFNIEVKIRNSNLIVFFEKSLPDVKIIPGKTDEGPFIKRNGISVDHDKTLEKVGNWIENLKSNARKESNLIKKINPNLVISDISAMPILAAHLSDKRSLAISNFSWLEVLPELKSEHVSSLEYAYDKTDLAIRLALGTEMKHFRRKKDVGILCRNPTMSKIEIRKKLGIDQNEFCVYVALNDYYSFNWEVGKKIKILSSGAKINSTNTIDTKSWIEGQDLVLASDLVICKCGYGFISECIINQTPFLYLMDDKHHEQIAISKELATMNLDFRINEEKLNSFKPDLNFISSFTKPKKINNDVETVIKIINEQLI